MANLQLPDDRLPLPDGLTIGAITAGVAFVMELTLLPLLLSAIKEAFELSLVDLAWVFNAYAVAIAITVLCSGLAGDVLDKRKLFMFGVAIFAAGSVLAANSSDLNALVMSRIVQGIGGGLFFPLVPVLLTQTNAERAGRILMIWGGLAGFAAAGLPILGGAMLASFGWPAIFVALAAVSMLALSFSMFGKEFIDPRGPRRVPDYRQLGSIRGYWLLLIYIFLTYGCFSFYLFRFPVSWHDNGFGDESVSILLTCVWLSFSFVSFLMRNKIEGIGLNWGLLAAPGLMGLSFVLALIDQDGQRYQALSAVLIGSGLACCNSPSTHLLLRHSPKDLRAISSSLDITFARCGSVATVALLATLSQLWVVIAVLALTILATYAALVFLSDFKPSD